MRDFLITGCGRSGTGWAASVFSELGFPCSHEVQFGLGVHGPLKGGEASWMAIPHLDSLGPCTPILRMMRDPYEVVASAMAKGFLADPDEPYSAYAIQHCPDIYQGAGRINWLARVIRYVALWDQPLGDRKVYGLRVESTARQVRLAVKDATGAEDLTDQDVATVLEKVGTTVNSSFRSRVTWGVQSEHIDAHPDGALIRKKAKRFYGRRGNE